MSCSPKIMDCRHRYFTQVDKDQVLHQWAKEKYKSPASKGEEKNESPTRHSIYSSPPPKAKIHACCLVSSCQNTSLKCARIRSCFALLSSPSPLALVATHLGFLDPRRLTLFSLELKTSQLKLKEPNFLLELKGWSCTSLAVCLGQQWMGIECLKCPCLLQVLNKCRIRRYKYK